MLRRWLRMKSKNNISKFTFRERKDILKNNLKFASSINVAHKRGLIDDIERINLDNFREKRNNFIHNNDFELTPIIVNK